MKLVPLALPEAAFAARVRQLTWSFHKWDANVRGRGTVSPHALVLTREEHASAVATAERLFALSQEAMERWAGDEEEARALGVDPALVPLAGAPTRERVTRVDLFLTDRGWMASEWNDDAPGGYNDALGLVALFADAAEKGLEAPGDLAGEMLRLLAPPGVRRVGLAYATGYAEDLQVARLLADLLESQGVETTLGSPAHLGFDEGRATLGGDEIDAIHRFFPAEWFPALPNLDAWRAAVHSGLRVVNPLACAWTQSKASFAHLRDPAIPRTTLLTPETARDALAERHSLVLKPAFGRMGEGVVLGSDRSADEWRKAIDGALHRPQRSVLQDRFRPLSVDAPGGASMTVCVGAYVVAGRFAGYYSRLSPRNVVRFDASNVLTLVEAS